MLTSPVDAVRNLWNSQRQGERRQQAGAVRERYLSPVRQQYRPSLKQGLVSLCAATALVGIAHSQEPVDTLGEFDEDTPFETFADDDEIDAAHEAYLKLPGLQLERPERIPEAIEPPPETPGWIKWLSRVIGNIFEFLGPVFKILFYLVIAGVIGGILYFLFGEAIRVRFGKDGHNEARTGDDEILDVRPDAQTARSLLEEADALARAGKFAEAVHLLLFRSIEDIQGHLENGVPGSLTAREIGGLSNLPERARRALSPIIVIVERSFFGGRDVDETSWSEARASYEDFAFGEGWA